MTAFRTAVIDPPWPYERASAHRKLSGYVDVARSQEPQLRLDGTEDGASQYRTMTLERLAELPVRSLLDGYLFLWTTGPFIPAAVKLVEAWGFDFKTLMYWVKTSSGSGGLAYGPGFWVRSCVEPLIIATSPRTPAVRTHERAAFLGPRLRHSAKPEAFQDFVERHFPGPRLEVFARRERADWTCIGNEISGHDIVDDMEALR